MESFQESNINQNSQDVERAGFDDGFIGGIAIGSQVHPNVRYELEGAYRENDAEAWFVEDFTGGVVTNRVESAATGDLESYTAMLNFLFDLPRRQPGCWNFYGGVGIGAVFVDGEIVTATNTYDVNDSSVGFQAIAGFTRAVNDRLDFYGEYKFLNAQKILVDDLTNAVSLGDFEYTNNSVVFGVRIRR